MLRCRKWNKDGEAQATQAAPPATASNGDASAGAKLAGRKLASRGSVSYPSQAGGRRSHDGDSQIGEHVPHSICKFDVVSRFAPPSKER